MNEPQDFPICLQLRGKRVLLVGGGKLATLRLGALLEVGARVRVVAPQVSAEIEGHARSGAVFLERRPFTAQDCDGAFVVFSATDDRGANRAVVEAARARGILVNAADAPELCDFTVPSIGRQGFVTVAVATSGQAPGLARILRHRLMAHVGPEYALLARLLGRLRRRVPGGPRRTRIISQIIERGAAELIARKDRRGLRTVVRQAFSSEEAQ